DAHQALAMNLVHKVAAPEELAAAARVWAEKLAAGATGSFAIAKENLNRALLPLLERQLEVERQGVLEAAYSDDYQEGLAAFLKKRKPLFKGS
ncbi:MAG: hypothetical protein HQP61_03845, partial [Peptococcaceae bacterium]|nr:hypothetical protein [Candidatus Syntrophopropionicum ammoniitolerans]